MLARPLKSMEEGTVWSNIAMEFDRKYLLLSITQKQQQNRIILQRSKVLRQVIFLLAKN